MPFRVVVIHESVHSVQIQNVCWPLLGFEVTANADTLDAGFRVVQSIHPDVVVIDLVTPVHRLSKWLHHIRHSLPECRIILYEKQKTPTGERIAVQLGIFALVTETEGSAALEGVLRRAVQALALDRDGRLRMSDAERRSSLYALLTNDDRYGFVSQVQSEYCGLSFDAYFIMVLQPQDACKAASTLCVNLDTALSSPDVRVLMLPLYDALVLFVILEGDPESWRLIAERMADHAVQFTSEPVRIGVSLLGRTRSTLRTVYQQARSALWDITLCEPNRFVSFYSSAPEQSGKRITDVHQRLDALLVKADLTDRSADEAAAVITDLSGRQYSHLRALVSLYTMALCRKYGNPTDMKTGLAMHEAWFAGNGEEVRTCLRHICEALRSSREAKESTMSLLTRNALWYIRIHASDAPSLQTVADTLHVSANHLSAIVRRETGTKFHEHVRAVRMEMARAMLADPRVSVAEVASAVGYGNYISFFNVFKRTERMTPTAYRQRQGRHIAFSEPTM